MLWNYHYSKYTAQAVKQVSASTPDQAALEMYIKHALYHAYSDIPKAFKNVHTLLTPYSDSMFIETYIILAYFSDHFINVTYLL